MKYGDLNLGQVEAIVNRLGGMKGVQRFLSGELVIQPASVMLSSIVHVDCLVRPTYPDWVKDTLNLELENGPVEFDLGRMEQWLHPDQVNGVVDGNRIYAYLKDNNMLGGCVGLRDLEEIQKKDIALFRQHFQRKAVFGWKSVVRNRDGHLSVPYLLELATSGMTICWTYLNNNWRAGDPALRFAS